MGCHPHLAARDQPRRRPRRAAAIRSVARHHCPGPALGLPGPQSPQARLQRSHIPDRVPAPQFRILPEIDLDALREALNSPRPAQTSIAALLGFYAIRIGQLCRLKLTDVCDGRLHLGDQVILLARPARERVSAYHSYSTMTWPSSINPRLFIRARSWTSTRPVTAAWIASQPRVSAQHIRLDRILDQDQATSGDAWALYDLFGMSLANSTRYATAIHRIADPGTLGDNDQASRLTHH
jgi:hypothetical protein